MNDKSLLVVLWWKNFATLSRESPSKFGVHINNMNVIFGYQWF
jgi:hypothetical protein